jgi:hypothetical protein
MLTHATKPLCSTFHKLSMHAVKFIVSALLEGGDPYLYDYHAWEWVSMASMRIRVALSMCMLWWRKVCGV